jgi:hypothetical protein
MESLHHVKIEISRTGRAFAGGRERAQGTCRSVEVPAKVSVLHKATGGKL